MKDGHNNIQEEQGEAFVSKIVHSIDSSITIPDGEESWNYMRVRLNKLARRSRYKRIAWAGMAMASLSIIIASFNGTQEGFAFRNLFTVVKNVENGLVHVLFGETNQGDSEGAKTAPPPAHAVDGKNLGSSPEDQQEKVIKPEEVSLIEARKILDFPLRTVRFIPEGYTEYRIKVYPDAEGRYRRLRMEYKNVNGDIFSLTQQKLVEKSTGWQTSINELSGKIKDVVINGSPGILVLYTEGGARLEWLSGDVLLEIYGKLSEDVITQVADSVKLE